MEPEYKGKIKFYDDQINAYFPTNFEKFKKKLGEMLGLSDDVLTNFRLSYKDEDNDKIQIKNEEDYKLFLEEIQKKKEELVLSIEIKEESSVLIKKCSSSIMEYISKNSSGNINNFSEEAKEKNNLLELSDEINPNNINKDNEKEKKEPNNNIINNIKDNNIINDPKDKDNKNENNLNLNKINEENNDIRNNNINNFNQNKNINNINNINNIIQNKNINNINNISQNKNNINNINNIENRNPLQQQPNNQMHNLQQPHQNPQLSQNQNQQNQNSQNNNQNNRFLYCLSFPYSCSLCRRGPIYYVMYFCRECQLILCHQCESREGPRHPHPFYKVLNKNQFEHLNIGGVSSIEKFMDGVGDTMEKGYNSILGWFGARNEESNNRNNRQVIQGPQWVSLVQIARASYDLRNFSDKQIEDALIKSKGNIDEAVILLAGA